MGWNLTDEALYHLPRRSGRRICEAIEQGSIVHGSILNIANQFTESTDDVLTMLCKISGAKWYEHRRPNYCKAI